MAAILPATPLVDLFERQRQRDENSTKAEVEGVLDLVRQAIPNQPIPAGWMPLTPGAEEVADRLNGQLAFYHGWGEPEDAVASVTPIKGRGGWYVEPGVFVLDGSAALLRFRRLRRWCGLVSVTTCREIGLGRWAKRANTVLGEVFVTLGWADKTSLPIELVEALSRGQDECAEHSLTETGTQLKWGRYHADPALINAIQAEAAGRGIDALEAAGWVEPRAARAALRRLTKAAAPVDELPTAEGESSTDPLERLVALAIEAGDGVWEGQAGALVHLDPEAFPSAAVLGKALASAYLPGVDIEQIRIGPDRVRGWHIENRSR